MLTLRLLAQHRAWLWQMERAQETRTDELPSVNASLALNPQICYTQDVLQRGVLASSAP